MKIIKEDLLFQILTALKDEFVANVTEVGDVLTLQFANGQSFAVEVQEK